MTTTEKLLTFTVLSFAAGVLAVGYATDYRSRKSAETLETLRAECQGFPGFSHARVLLDSLTAQPYCLRVMDGTRNVHLVRPMAKGAM
jgi:hypothetical protein